MNQNGEMSNGTMLIPSFMKVGQLVYTVQTHASCIAMKRGLLSQEVTWVESFWRKNCFIL